MKHFRERLHWYWKEFCSPPGKKKETEKMASISEAAAAMNASAKTIIMHAYYI